MKKIMLLAAIQAIALIVALNFGLNWLFFGIGLTMLLEYCYFTVYETSMTSEYFAKQLVCSRRMLMVHAGFCVTTLILAAAMGVLGGYDLWEEIQQGNSFDYKAVHQNGSIWWFLIVLLFIRVFVQTLIEKAIKENTKLSLDREA